MPPRKRAGRGESVSQPAPTPHTQRGANSPGENRSSEADAALVAAETRHYPCPCCGRSRKLHIKRALGRYGVPETLIRCVACGAVLDDISEASGIPRYRLLNWSDPPDELGAPQGTAKSNGARSPMPSEATIAGASSRLISSEQYAPLVDEGLWPETIARAELGLYDHRGRLMVGFPIGRQGHRRGIVYRATDGSEPPYVHLGGWSTTFYRGMPGRRQCWVLCAGMRKPLVASQYPLPEGRPLPVLTTSCGVTLPGHLVPYLAGKTVAVMYDVGEEDAAERSAATLRATGGDAWIVRLSELGLPDKGDLNDYFNGGGTSAELLAHIAQERQAT